MAVSHKNERMGVWFLERIKGLGRYQKGILLFMSVMILVFAAVYSVTIKRVGFAYQNEIFIHSQEGGTDIYSGKMNGKQACFRVSADRTVVFQYGERSYGPYTATEDPAAVSKDGSLGEDITGIEVRDGEKNFFRGGIRKVENRFFLYNEDGELDDSAIFLTTNDGVIMMENGTKIDPMEPSVYTILELMSGPELTHKGDWTGWLGGVLVCVVTAISMLFADEIFRWNLAFQIRNADRAEPSEWEMAGRYIGWTLLPVAALIFFITGLQ